MSVIKMQQGSTPSAAGGTIWSVYFKSNGIYMLSPAGAETQLMGSSTLTPSSVGLGNVTNNLQIYDSNFPGTSVDSQLAVFSGTTGKAVKASTLTGIIKASSGVPSAATGDSDYALPPVASAVTLDVSGNMATPGSKINWITLDTFGAASAQNMGTISGGVAGDIIKIQLANASHAVTLVNSASLYLGANFTLNSIYDRIELECHSAGVWVQRWRSSNA